MALHAQGTAPVWRGSGVSERSYGLGALTQRLGENRDLGGMSFQLGLAARVGDAGEDAAPVVVADLATDEAIVLQALDEAGEGALAQMDLFGELLDAARSLGRGGEAAEGLGFGEGEAGVPLGGGVWSALGRGGVGRQ